MSKWPTNQPVEIRRFRYSLFISLFFALLLFAIKLVEETEHLDLSGYGIRPRSMDGLWGIWTAPFIHGDWAHLWSNLTSFVALGTALFYFYKDLSFRVLLVVYLFSGAFVWVIGRDSSHIGSSGIIYGLAAFLLFSGIIRQYIPLMAISLIVVFFYGSMVWGIFPLHINLPYSWEAHLGGTLGGILASLAMRKSGPQKPIKKWEDDDDDALENGDKYWEVTTEKNSAGDIRE